MQAELNDSRFIGEVMGDPALEQTRTGTPVARFLLRVDTTCGQVIESVELACEWFGKRAGEAGPNLVQGARLLVNGRLIQRGGGDSYVTGLLVNGVVILGNQERVDTIPAAR